MIKMKMKKLCAADGTIYTPADHNGKHFRGLHSYQLEASASELTKLSQYISDAGIFFSGTFDKQTPMLEEEFNELYKKHTTLQNPMQFKFIPIEQ